MRSQPWMKEALQAKFCDDRETVYDIAKRVRRGDESVNQSELDFAERFIRRMRGTPRWIKRKVA